MPFVKNEVEEVVISKIHPNELYKSDYWDNPLIDICSSI